MNDSSVVDLVEGRDKINAGLVSAAPKSMLHFTLATMPQYNIGWHHDKLANALHRVASGKCKRLMVFMPPRHGKTELVSVRFPAWILGRDPNKQIIGVSYGAGLANRNAKQIKKVISSSSYKSIFPKTKLSTKKHKKDEDNGVNQANFFEIEGHRGYYRAAGVGGTITGTGGDIIIVDDIIKNRKEANSPKFRERAWEEFNDTLKTRLEGENAALIIVMTRWHEDDLAGRLIKKMRDEPDAEQYEILSLEALKEDLENKSDTRKVDEALWPWKYNEEYLKKLKANTPAMTWNALYQQRPSSMAGNIFKRENLGNFYKLKDLPNKFDKMVLSLDATFEDNDDSDYVVGQAWGKSGVNYYLLAQFRQQMGYVQTKKEFRLLCGQFPQVLRKIIEKKANGAALIEEMSKEFSGIVGYTPTESKISRANAVSTLYDANNIWLPDPSIASWVRQYVEELATFPNGINDDQVDCSTQALIDMMGPAAFFEA